VTVEQIVALANAGALVLLSVVLLTGQVWAKPGVDFLMAQLTKTEVLLAASLSREEKLADSLRENSSIVKEFIAELRRMYPQGPR
jgi:hypothetical protein